MDSKEEIVEIELGEDVTYKSFPPGKRGGKQPSIKIPESVKQHWPLGFLALGLAAIGTAAGLAATSHPWALIPVGTSNLSMVLTLTGASLALFSIWLWYGTSDRLYNVKSSILYSGIPAIVIAAAGYGGVHIGIAETANLLPAGLTEWQSVGAQFGIGFGIGLLVTALYSIYFTSLNTGKRTFNECFADNKVHFLTIAPLFGVLCGAASIAGPALSIALGAAAENATERMAMEATISVGIASFMLLACTLAWMAKDAWRERSKSSDEYIVLQ